MSKILEGNSVINRYNSNEATFQNFSAFSIAEPEGLQYVSTVLMVAYAIISVVGLFGNTLVMFVVLKHSRMKTVANYFVLNLAITDELYLLTLPFNAYSTHTGNWPFGENFCKVNLVIGEVNNIASIFTMVVMCADRFLAISFPVRSLRYRTVLKAQITIFTIWVISLVLLTPIWLYSKVKPAYPSGYNCGVYWPPTYFEYWVTFRFIIGFVIPLLVIAGFYMAMIKNMQTTVAPEDVTGPRPPNKRVTLMVLLVVLVFVVCWTPHHVSEFASVIKAKQLQEMAARYETYTPTPKDIIDAVYLYTASQIMIAVSSCVNPFIYGLRSENYRRLYQAAICKCRINQVELDSNETGPREIARIVRTSRMSSASKASGSGPNAESGTRMLMMRDVGVSPYDSGTEDMSLTIEIAGPSNINLKKLKLHVEKSDISDVKPVSSPTANTSSAKEIDDNSSCKIEEYSSTV